MAIKISELSVVLSLASVQVQGPASKEQEPVDTCDLLASSVTDPDRVVPGVSLSLSKALAAKAACERALAAHPENGRFASQLFGARVSAGEGPNALIEGLSELPPSQIYGDLAYQIAAAFMKSAHKNANSVALAYYKAAMDDRHPGATLKYWDLTEGTDRVATAVEVPWDYWSNWSLRFRRIANLSVAVPEDRTRAANLLHQLNVWREPNAPISYVTKEDGRFFVSDVDKFPFSAIGIILIKSTVAGGRCTAALVGDTKTIVTASHCIRPGATYEFRQGKLLNSVRAATVVASGARRSDIAPDFPAWDSNVGTPNSTWDDWAILTLDTPVATKPLSIPSAEEEISIRTGSFFTDKVNFLAGFPGDVFGGMRMVFSPVVDPRPFPLDFNGAFPIRVAAQAYPGNSGGPLISLDRNGRAIGVGTASVLEPSSESELRYERDLHSRSYQFAHTTITLSGEMLVHLRKIVSTRQKSLDPKLGK